MNRSWVSKFAGLVLVLTLITTSLVAGTYAKYTTEYTGTGTVVVAKWQADLGVDSAPITDDFDFNLFDTTGDTGVLQSLNTTSGAIIAPGTSGSFTFTYDTSDSEVAHSLLVALDVSGDLITDLSYLEFRDTNSSGSLITPVDGVITFVNADYAAGAGPSVSKTVYWSWPFSADSTQDEADTIAGIAAGASYNVTLTFTATQLDTYPEP